MTRIDSTFQAISARQGKALIPYITAGDPTLDTTVPLMHRLVEAGADVIELGMPFSDPMAEGPVIQAAHERALVHGTSMQDVLTMVSNFRQQDTTTPIVLMGYLNPLEIMGYQRFAQAAAAAGVDGILIVDLPPEEGKALNQSLREQGLDQIYLISPTTSEQRLALIQELGSGYHYYVSVKGVTGSKRADSEDIAAKLQPIRDQLNLPICVGFGIRDAESAQSVAKLADGVVIGSAIIDKMTQFSGDNMLAEVTTFISGIRAIL